MKRDLCLESRFARVDLQSINLYIVFFTLPMCISNDLILHWGRGYIMFVCYRHSKVHVQTNGTPLCNLFNKPVYPFKNFIPKMCPFCPQNMKRNICNTKTGLVAGVFNLFVTSLYQSNQWEKSYFPYTTPQYFSQ